MNKVGWQEKQPSIHIQRETRWYTHHYQGKQVHMCKNANMVHHYLWLNSYSYSWYVSTVQLTSCIKMNIVHMFPVSLAWKYSCECVGCWVISWLFATWKSLRRGDMEQLNWILAGNLRKQMDFSYIWQQISHFPVAQKICCCQLLFDNLNISPWSGGLACALLDCLFWWVCPADSILSVLSKAQLW